MAAPPTSDDLPIGDKAETISDGDDFGVILIASEADATCARFYVNDIAVSGPSSARSAPT